MGALLYHSLTEGDFGNGLLLRQSLVEGDFWTLLGGCYLVYRGEGNIDDIDYEQAGAVSFLAGKFDLPGQIVHKASTDYFYSVRRVSGTGRAERGTMAVVKLALDENGKRGAPHPNAVRNLKVELTGTGRVRLIWWYVPLGQQVAPISFAVFGDNGMGTIDYENALTQIPYTGRYYYDCEIEAGQEDKECRFSVRSIAVDGSDDGNTAFVAISPDLVGPVGIEGVQGRVGF